MPTSPEFVTFVTEQIENAGVITARMMFGEYAVYADGKLFGLICDNKLFIKPTAAGQAFAGRVTEAPPYPGAKNSFLIDERIDDRQWLSDLVRVTVKELPWPKDKKKKKK
jgi:TfoX/Sxy family transcriptional regulator of competence genes